MFELILEHSNVVSHYCHESVKSLNYSYPASVSKKNIVICHGNYLSDYQNIPKTVARNQLQIHPENL